MDGYIERWMGKGKILFYKVRIRVKFTEGSVDLSEFQSTACIASVVSRAGYNQGGTRRPLLLTARKQVLQGQVDASLKIGSRSWF